MVLLACTQHDCLAEVECEVWERMKHVTAYLSSTELLFSVNFDQVPANRYRIKVPQTIKYQLFELLIQIKKGVYMPDNENSVLLAQSTENRKSWAESCFLYGITRLFYFTV